MSHLSGGYLRLGGNAADQVVFTPAHRTWPDKYLPLDGGECAYNHTNCNSTVKKIKKFSMSGKSIATQLIILLAQTITEQDINTHKGVTLHSPHLCPNQFHVK